MSFRDLNKEIVVVLRVEGIKANVDKVTLKLREHLIVVNESPTISLDDDQTFRAYISVYAGEG